MRSLDPSLLLSCLLSCLLSLPACDERPGWDLTPPPGVKSDNALLSGLVEDMRTAPFDSRKTEDAIRDLTLADNRKHGVPTLCAAMAKPDFKNLFGPCNVASRLFKDGQKTLASRMLPFLAAVSERTTEAEGLSAFAWVAPSFRDLRVVPRLIQLLEHPCEQVRRDATRSLSQLTLVPIDKVTPAEMRAWQLRNKGRSSTRIWHEGLASKDPRMAMAAATMAFGDHDKDVIGALCLVLRCTDRRLVEQAGEMLTRITGNDWGCNFEVPPAERVKRVAKLEKWWAAEMNSFQWMCDRQSEGPKDEGLVGADATVAVAVDPHRLLIEELGSTDGLQSEHAETKLLELGKHGVPSLINGLEDANLVVRRKSDRLLKAISKQDMGYDPRADAEALHAAIARWKAWAASQQISLDPASAADGKATEGQTTETAPVAPDPEPAPRPTPSGRQKNRLPRGL